VAARRPEALVLGADTTVFIDGRVLNKPHDLAKRVPCCSGSLAVPHGFHGSRRPARMRPAGRDTGVASE